MKAKDTLELKAKRETHETRVLGNNYPRVRGSCKAKQTKSVNVKPKGRKRENRKKSTNSSAVVSRDFRASDHERIIPLTYPTPMVKVDDVYPNYEQSCFHDSLSKRVITTTRKLILKYNYILKYNTN